MTNFFMKKVLSIVLFLMTTTLIMAQTTVTGPVVEAANNEPLAGVNIIVKGKVIGTITDLNGQFSLTVNSEPPFILQTSFIGFSTKEIEITENETSGLTITLEESSILGEEVVVSAP